MMLRVICDVLHYLFLIICELCLINCGCWYCQRATYNSCKMLFTSIYSFYSKQHYCLLSISSKWTFFVYNTYYSCWQTESLMFWSTALSFSSRMFSYEVCPLSVYSIYKVLLSSTAVSSHFFSRKLYILSKQQTISISYETCCIVHTTASDNYEVFFCISW